MSAPALLREWDLLEQEVIPPLLKVGRSRSPRVWSIGSMKDALAVSLAAHELNQASSKQAPLRVFLSGQTEDTTDLSFALPDIRCIPTKNRNSLLRQDRRWVPSRDVADSVVLAEPSAPVDLVTVRLDQCDHPSFGAAVASLRRGGQLLLMSPEPSDVADRLDGLEATAREYRLFRKDGPCRRPQPEAGDAAEADAETLVRHQYTQKLIEDHVRLARSLARRFAHHGEASDDLDQVAFLALVKAARRFDESRDVRFATYATASILGELKRHFRDKTWMLRVPRPIQELYLSVKQARDELTQDLGTAPTVAQIAAHLSVSEADVIEAMEAGDNYWPVSLDVRISEDEPVREVPVIDPSFEQTLARLDLERLAPTLDERETRIVKRLYFDGWTQRRVADEIGVSQMQVSRILARALAKLQG